MEEWKGIEDWNNTEIIDADGMVFLRIVIHILILFLLQVEKGNL